MAGGADTVAGARRAFLWAGGELADLGTLPGGALSDASRVGTAGEVLGASTTAPGQVLDQAGSRAVVWAGNSVTDLGTLPGGAFDRAGSSNVRGEIAGHSQNGVGAVRAVVLQAGGAVTGLGTLPGYAGSRAFRIDAAGQVASTVEGGEAGAAARAFLYQAGALADLGSLGEGAAPAPRLG